RHPLVRQGLGADDHSARLRQWGAPADHRSLLHPVRTFDPGEGYLARHRGAARRARGAQSAHRHARRGFAARPPQGRRRRADRLAVLYPAGSEGRQCAAHRARSHPRHPEELGIPAQPQDGGPELVLSPTGHSRGPRLMRRDARSARQWVRVHPDADMTLATSCYVDRENRETYLVVPEMREVLITGVKVMLLATAVTSRGSVFLWPLALGDDTGRTNAWHETARDAAMRAKSAWTKLAADMSAGHYRILQADRNLPEHVC